MHRDESWARRTARRIVASLRSSWWSLGRLPVVRQWRARGLRRLQPFGNGRPRGTAVMRYYWDAFLETHRADVRGRGLEIGTTSTLTRVGGAAIVQADALDLSARPGVTLVSDLSRADHVPSDAYDCFVVPFTTHLIYDIDAALYHAVRVLKPGGVLLVNFPCVDYYFPRGLDMQTGKPLFMFWWFTPIQVQNLLRRIGLPEAAFQIDVFGNLFSRVAYQMNMTAEELTSRERDHRDEGHPLLICARIVKPAGWEGVRPAYRDAWTPEVTPDQWNRDTGHYPRV